MNRAVYILATISLLGGCSDAEQTDQTEQTAEPAYEWPEHLSLEETRRAAWVEIVLAEDRAVRESDEAYPTGDLIGSEADAQLQKWAELFGRLDEQYKNEVWKEYRLTPETHLQIALESVAKKWPPPPKN